MHQMEVLTGIKAHTLRVWERRYGFPNPQRTKTNIRYYTDEQLKKLLRVSVLINQDYKISRINQMTDYEINDVIYKLSTNGSEDCNREVQMLTIATIEMDEVEFNHIIMGHIQKKGLTKTIFGIIYPYLKHIGVLWGTNKLIPAQEHFATNIIRHKIITKIDELSNTTLKSPSIVLFLIENEFHDIGLLMSAYLAKKMGWKVYYLGQNVPLSNVIAVQNKIKPTIMGTIISTPSSKKTIKNLLTLDDEISCQLLISSHEDDIKKLEFKNVKFIGCPKSYCEILEDSSKNTH